jgi:hypothetical protein
MTGRCHLISIVCTTSKARQHSCSPSSHMSIWAPAMLYRLKPSWHVTWRPTCYTVLHRTSIDPPGFRWENHPPKLATLQKRWWGGVGGNVFRVLETQADSGWLSQHVCGGSIAGQILFVEALRLESIGHKAVFALFPGAHPPSLISTLQTWHSLQQWHSNTHQATLQFNGCANNTLAQGP